VPCCDNGREQRFYWGIAMTLLRSLGRLLRTRSFAGLLLIVGGTLIRYGTVAKRNQLMTIHWAEAYGGLAIVIVGFILFRIAVASNRRRKRLLASAGATRPPAPPYWTQEDERSWQYSRVAPFARQARGLPLYHDSSRDHLRPRPRPQGEWEGTKNS
jgi:hypothetical protein